MRSITSFDEDLRQLVPRFGRLGIGFFYLFEVHLLLIILFLVTSKYYARGTTEVVVALGKKNLGNLKYMEISHNGLLEAWYLKAVKIKPMYTQKE